MTHTRHMRPIAASFALLALLVPAAAKAAPPGAVPGGAVVAVSAVYTPSDITIVAGTQLRFVNLSAGSGPQATTHTLTSVDGLFDTGDTHPGDAAAVAGTETLPPGTYGFVCQYHPMWGTLTVVGP